MGASAPRATPSEERALLAAAAALACLYVATLHHVRFDDAYITFRYGANLARGRGLVFNAGDRLMGSTSPGECLIAALAYAIAGRDRLLDVMAALGCVAWVAEGVVFFRMLRDRLGAFGAALVGLAVATGMANGAPWVALETHLTTAFALLALHLAIARRPLAAAAAAAAATLMRPDAGLLLAPLGALAWIDLRRAAWKPIAIYAALLLPWVLFATIYFGTPLPQSAVRKFQRSDVLTYAEHVGILFAFPFGVRDGWRFATPIPWALAVAGAVSLARRDRRLLALVAYPVLHVGAYLVLRPDVAFAWHLYPATACFSAFVIARLVSIPVKGQLPGRIVACAAVLHAVWQAGLFAWVDSRRGTFGGRDGIYRAVSAYLRTRAEPDDLVGCEEVGTIGYFTDLPMNDNAGLTTRDPMRVYRDFLARTPTKLRWLVLSKVEVRTVAVIYGGRTLVPIEVDGYARWVVDLRESPRLPPAP